MRLQGAAAFPYVHAPGLSGKAPQGDTGIWAGTPGDHRPSHHPPGERCVRCSRTAVTLHTPQHQESFTTITRCLGNTWMFCTLLQKLKPKPSPHGSMHALGVKRSFPVLADGETEALARSPNTLNITWSGRARARTHSWTGSAAHTGSLRCSCFLLP